MMTAPWKTSPARVYQPRKSQATLKRWSYRVKGELVLPVGDRDVGNAGC